MTFGICLQVLNHIHYKKRMNIKTEFLPQMLYLWSIFGYLVFLIIFKWLNDWEGRYAPNLLNTLIYMVLSPGSVAEKEQLYPGQVHFFHQGHSSTDFDPGSVNFNSMDVTSKALLFV
jgi:V-type H+-transporting ATPase subunit a